MKTRTALLLLVATGCVGGVGCSGSTRNDGEGGTGAIKMTLKRMQSCAELETTLKADARAKMNRQIDAIIENVHRGWANGGYGSKGGAEPPMAGSGESTNAGAPRDSATPAPTAPGGAGSSGGTATGDRAASHSETNTQVKGVDEADIVKTDGKYIFLLHGQSFTVLNAWPSSDLGQAASFAIEGQPSEMFVAGDKVVVYSRVDGAPVYAAAGVTPRAEYHDGAYYGGGRGDVAVAPSYPGGGGGYYANPLTKITVLTLQGTTPSVARELYFEGSYLSSRRVDTHVRTVLTGGAHGPALRYYPEYNYDNGTPPAYPQTEAEAVALYERLRAENNAKIDATRSTDWLPYLITKEGGQVVATSQKCEDLWVPPSGTTEYGLTQVEAIDLANPAAPPKGQAIIGAVDTVYSSADAMYLASRSWIDPWVTVLGQPVATSGGGSASSGSAGSAPPPDSAASPPSGPSSPPTPTPGSSRPQSTPVFAPNTEVTVNFTHIHKFDLTRDASSPEYVASGTAPGNIKDQFSMDERSGVLRITTTERKALLNPTPTTEPTRGNESSNNVVTFAQSGGTLVKQGEVRNMAPGEQVFSTRFVGRYGYVVTFRQVDPLFVVDLDNPAAPRVLGELKIPGFSTYMHPLDDGHLLTIGRDADSSGRQLGLALQIFDVTNPMSPRQAHKFTFSGAEYGYSEAGEEHKAFTYFAEKKLLAFPYVAHSNTSGGYGMRSSLEVFDIDIANGIHKRGSIDHTALFGTNTRGYCGGYFSPNVRRGLFLDNVVYSVSYAGVIASDIASVGTPIKTLALPQPQIQGYPGCATGGPVDAGETKPADGG